MSYKKGFTLIELLVVVLIIGILAAIALPQYEKAVEKSRIAEAKIALNTMKRNYELCVLEFGPSGPDVENECSYMQLLNNLTVPLPGEFEADPENCATRASACFKTKDWIYDTDDNGSFYANRVIGDSNPYDLFIDYSNGNITCFNEDTTTKDYCTMLCGANRCTL